MLFDCSDEVGIDRWNELNDEYAFVYINPKQSNKKVLVKCLVIANKLMVDALLDGATEQVHLDIKYIFLSTWMFLFFFIGFIC